MKMMAQHLIGGIYTITEKDRKKKIINIIDGVMKKEDMNRKMCKVKKKCTKIMDDRSIINKGEHSFRI